MKEESIKAKITIPIPYDRPNRNGVIYTQEAVENAVNNLHKNLPIIYRDSDKEIGGINIGNTTGQSHIVTWDFKNKVCNLTVDGVICGGPEYIINETNNGVITDFKITGFGLSK